MGYQFVHLESFSRKGDDKGRSTAFVLAEARRDPAASVHVTNPSPPVVIFGVGVAEVEALHDAAAEAARTVPKAGKPRKLRQDHKTLHTVIASHPYTMDEVRADAAKRSEAEVWERRTVAWLRAQYGDDLKSVVRHEDESHYHIHAYVVPTDDPEMRALRHHPGVTAKRAAMAAGPGEGEDSKALSKRGDREYKAAMRMWQDSYHETVGVPCGLARLGPRRRNLPRGEWQREKAQAKALQAALDRAAVVKDKVESFVAVKKSETESLVATAASEAAALRADADAAQADAARRLAEAKTATDAAMREDGRPRVVVPLRVVDAMVLDQHDEEACRHLGIDRELSNESWRSALSEGREPASWRAVDIVRAAGADGIIDRSRMIPGGWHLNLFRWNESGGPLVEVCGDPVEIVLSTDGPKWGL